MHNWAPIVHGRTAYVDFRSNLIVVPEDFTEDDITWARNFILATTRDAEDLRQHPRWSIFSNDRYGVIGVTCMASAVSTDMTREIVINTEGQKKERRDLYVFLGYAAPLPFPGILSRDLEIFKPLYQFIRDRWEEKERDPSKDRVHRGPYKYTLPTIAGDLAGSGSFNLDTRKVKLWPTSDNDRLWEDALMDGSFSLCLGLAGDVLKSPFANATTLSTQGPPAELTRVDSSQTRASSVADSPRQGLAVSWGEGSRGGYREQKTSPETSPWQIFLSAVWGWLSSLCSALWDGVLSLLGLRTDVPQHGTDSPAKKTQQPVSGDLPAGYKRKTEGSEGEKNSFHNFSYSSTMSSSESESSNMAPGFRTKRRS